MSAIQDLLAHLVDGLQPFEAVSSGPKTRKVVGLSRMMSRRNFPSGLVFP
jgi:hypothetical protein